MATKTMTLNPGDRPDKKQLKEIQAASEMPIHFTDDAPMLSEKDLSEFRPANPKYFRPVKELISLLNNVGDTCYDFVIGASNYDLII